MYHLGAVVQKSFCRRDLKGSILNRGRVSFVNFENSQRFNVTLSVAVGNCLTCRYSGNIKSAGLVFP